jgi:hypothetical protein
LTREDEEIGDLEIFEEVWLFIGLKSWCGSGG